jgi:hypothetical protein
MNMCLRIDLQNVQTVMHTAPNPDGEPVFVIGVANFWRVFESRTVLVLAGFADGERGGTPAEQ